jgi:RecB family exonuclease
MEEVVEQISIHLVSREDQDNGPIPATAYQHGLQRLEPVVREHEAIRTGDELPEVIFDPVAHAPFYGQALFNEYKRWGTDDWGPVDGVFTDEKLIDTIRCEFFGADPGISSSGDYGNYQECPRKFLFERVLDLEEEDDGPEDQEGMDHLTLGSLVHGLLESLVDRLKDAYPEGDWDAEEAEDIARTIFEDHAEHYERTACVGTHLHWKRTRKQIWTMVQHALAELRTAQENGWRPVETEWGIYDRTLFNEVLETYLSDTFGTTFTHGLEAEQTRDVFLAELGKQPNAEQVNVSPVADESEVCPVDGDTLRESYEDHAGERNRRPVTLDVSENEKVRFGGYVDRIDRRDGDEGFEFRVIDYKTGKKKKYQDNVLIKRRKRYMKPHPQLPIYWLMVEEHEGEGTVQEAKYFFVKEGADKLKGIDAYHWTEEQGAGLKERFFESVAHWGACLDDGIFTTTSRCEYCPFEQICGGSAYRQALARRKNADQPFMEQPENGHPQWIELLDCLDNE